MPLSASDGLLDLLHPMWQAVIGGCLLIVLVLGVRRLAQRGPTRMSNGMLVAGLLIVAITVLTAVASQFH